VQSECEKFFERGGVNNMRERCKKLFLLYIYNVYTKYINILMVHDGRGVNAHFKIYASKTFRLSLSTS